MSGMIQIPFGQGMVSHFAPAMPPSAYKTYGAAFPLRTHWRKASCEEVGCEAYLSGWKTLLDEATEQGQYHAATIKSLRGYKYTVLSMPSGLTEYSFPAGQKCFRASTHRIQLARPGRFYVYHGDFRARAGAPRVHHNTADWVEDFAEHQDRLITAIGKG